MFYLRFDPHGTLLFFFFFFFLEAVHCFIKQYFDSFDAKFCDK
jgi:hypothetical protein